MLVNKDSVSSFHRPFGIEGIPRQRSMKRYSFVLWLVGLVGFASLIFTDISNASTSYTIVDTNQVKCFDANIEIICPAVGAPDYGQDAQFTGNPSSYTLSVNGVTVYDNVTGLTWERSPDTNGDGLLTKADKFSYSYALAHCAEHSSITKGSMIGVCRQLKSFTPSLIFDFRGTDPSGYSGTDTSSLIPFINTAYFNFAYGDTNAGERIIDSQYASSTMYIDNPGGFGYPKLFGVNFADGRIKGYEMRMPQGEKTFFVQCVRGNPNYGINVFVDNADQTITDSATNLMWTKSDNGLGLNWLDALAWVQTKNAENYLGYNDWRMPNAKELQSIVDYTRSPSTSNSATIDPIFDATSFTNEGGQTDWPWYWTSTTHGKYTGMGGEGIYITFGRALGWQKVPPDAPCYTLYDVHGAGAQRSDPKTTRGIEVIGRTCSGGTAYGHGPQGDVQRAANYVRLVRDVGGVISTQPDFIVTGIALTPTSPAANSTFTALVTVKNQGTVSADGGQLSLWANQSAIQPCDAFGDKTVAVGPLAVGESKILTVNDLPAGSTGSKALRAFVDNTCVTSESNENNNQVTQTYTVDSSGQSSNGVIVTNPVKVTTLFSDQDYPLYTFDNLPVTIERMTPAPYTFPSGQAHYYEVVYTPQGGINWVQAAYLAEQAGGYLVSVTTQAENEFVFGLISDQKYWFQWDSTHNYVMSGPFIGAYQPSGSPEPNGGWVWRRRSRRLSIFIPYRIPRLVSEVARPSTALIRYAICWM